MNKQSVFHYHQSLLCFTIGVAWALIFLVGVFAQNVLPHFKIPLGMAYQWWFLPSLLCGLITFLVGYPIQILCNKLKIEVIGQRSILAFGVSAILVFSVVIFFQFSIHAEISQIWLKPFIYSGLIGLVSMFSIALFDKLTSMMNRAERENLLLNMTASLSILLVAISICICLFTDVQRGTPQVYDYASNFAKYPHDETVFRSARLSDTGLNKLKDGRLISIVSMANKSASVIALRKDSELNSKFSQEIIPRLDLCSIVPLDDGTALVIGGKTDGKPVSSVLRFDPVSMSFEKFADLNIPRYFHGAKKLNNGNVLVFGGQTTEELSDSEVNMTSTIELIDVKKKVVTLVGQMHIARLKAEGVPTGLNKCYIVWGENPSGIISPNFDSGLVSKIEFYDGKTTASKRRDYPPEAWAWCFSRNFRHPK